MKRAVPYARVSTEMLAAASRSSLDAQRAAFHAHWLSCSQVSRFLGDA